MTTNSIFKNIELDEYGLSRFLKTIEESKNNKNDNTLCDYCNKEVTSGLYSRKIGNRLYCGHKLCMIKIGEKKNKWENIR